MSLELTLVSTCARSCFGLSARGNLPTKSVVNESASSLFPSRIIASATLQPSCGDTFHGSSSDSASSDRRPISPFSNAAPIAFPALRVFSANSSE